jgi:anti-anti-sigma regulatory factor
MSIPGSAITTVRADGALVVSVSRGGLAAATELHGELDDAVARGARRVVVDLGAMPPLDLDVVGVLLASVRRMKEADGSLVLLAPDANALDLTGGTMLLADHFRVERSLAEAIAATGEAAA